MTKPQRRTPDSPRSHDAPIDDSPPVKRGTDDYRTKDVNREPALSTDEKELGRYLDALLDRERATVLSAYGASYKALERGEIDIYEHNANMAYAIPEIPISTDAAGVKHLSPSWRAFDPGLAREIRYQLRVIETSRRFPSASTLQLPFEGIPAHGERPEGIVLPTPQYRGAKAGRKIVGVGRPTAKVAPTFYLPRMSEVNDTLSASSARSLVGGGKFGDKQPRADRVSDSDQYEAIALCIDLARAVVERIVSVDALAEVLIRLGAPLSVRETCFGLLGHRDRKRLGKALRT